MPQLTYNPGLTLTRFLTTRPCLLILRYSCVVFIWEFLLKAVNDNMSICQDPQATCFVHLHVYEQGLYP